MSLETVGLFAGIGGLELGASAAGHHASLLVESAPAAARVLQARFPGVAVASDVRELDALPAGTGLLLAGFPCQDLSSVGQKAGIGGDRSSLVGEVFRLLRTRRVPWLVLENVPFLLALGRGQAMHTITDELAALGYRWAYRVVDTNSFGLPQRRNRWYLVASTEGDPREVLFADAGSPPPVAQHAEVGCGFYWTEGMRALGWAVDAVPPIKCGSSVGVASPPAIWRPDGTFFTPDIRDAERLQGFPEDWTQPAEEVARVGERWRLVGNSVSVPVSRWIGERLREPGSYDASDDVPWRPEQPWPRRAAWCMDGRTVHVAAVGPWPVCAPRLPLLDFLRHPGKPLSGRAAVGFLGRTEKGSLRFPEGFLPALRAYAAIAQRAA